MANFDLDLDSIFSHHAPPNDETVELHSTVRNICRDAAEFFQGALPPCPEKTLAIRSLQEAMMWANSAVAQHPVGS